jgi:hypothetical protein
MISPRSPIRVAGIPYSDRVLMAVAHLFIDEINDRVPVWLDEGIASFEGGAEGYRRICELPAVANLLKSPPQIADLESSYYKLPAADVFSFTLVDYIISNHGIAALSELIRRPNEFERILGGSKAELQSRWHGFVRTRYTRRAS